MTEDELEDCREELASQIDEMFQDIEASRYMPPNLRERELLRLRGLAEMLRRLNDTLFDRKTPIQ